MASENCPHCLQPRECDCPEGRSACRRGACPCPPNCPCKRGCLPPWFPGDDDWRRRAKFGCLPVLLGVLVIITILILTRDNDSGSSQNTPRTTTTTTTPPSTSTTEPVATTTTPATTTAAPTTVGPVITPVSPDLRRLIDTFCLPVPDDASDDAAADILFSEFDTTTGPDPGDSPPPLNSDDPALRFLRVGMLDGDCGGDAATVFVAELGGAPLVVQLAAALDLVADAGATPNPTGNSGIARVGLFDVFIAVEPDGTTFVSDSTFQPIDQRVAALVSGNYVALAVYDSAFVPLGSELTYHLQTFRRDVQESGAPIDWELATGRSR